MKHRLYVVAVRIDNEGAIIICMVVGAYSRCTIVGAAGRQGSHIKLINMLA